MFYPKITVIRYLPVSGLQHTCWEFVKRPQLYPAPQLAQSDISCPPIAVQVGAV